MKELKECGLCLVPQSAIYDNNLGCKASFKIKNTTFASRFGIKIKNV